MLIFINYYSRFTWVYFVKNKLEVFKTFLEFKELVEGVLGSKIKRLQTHNGGDFTYEEFLTFL